MIKLSKLVYLSIFFISFYKNTNATQTSSSNIDAYQESSYGILQALNKITGQVTSIQMKVNQHIKFGKINVKLLRCLKKKPELTPDSLAFITIHENVDQDSPSIIFSGWMFSSTPSISALEHPVYDIWIKECHTPSSEVISSPENTALDINSDKNTFTSLEPVQIPIDASKLNDTNDSDDPIQALCKGLNTTQ